MSEKAIGYILLASGIVIMIFSTIQIILVFTGKLEPISAFSSKTATPANQSGIDISALMQQLQPNAGTTNGPVKAPALQLIDPEVLNHTLNLTVHFFIMQFLLSLGFKLSSLGVQMLRPIEIKLDSKTVSQKINP